MVFSWLFRGPLLCRKTVFGPFSLLFRGFFVAFSWLFRGPCFGQILRVLALEQSSDVWRPLNVAVAGHRPPPSSDNAMMSPLASQDGQILHLQSRRCGALRSEASLHQDKIYPHPLGDENSDHGLSFPFPQRRTNVQQLTCKMVWSFSFYSLLFSFLIFELKQQ